MNYWNTDAEEYSNQTTYTNFDAAIYNYKQIKWDYRYSSNINAKDNLDACIRMLVGNFVTNSISTIINLAGTGLIRLKQKHAFNMMCDIESQKEEESNNLEIDIVYQTSAEFKEENKICILTANLAWIVKDDNDEIWVEKSTGKLKKVNPLVYNYEEYKDKFIREFLGEVKISASPEGINYYSTSTTTRTYNI